MEEWRWIPGYEGRYEVSDHGRVKSHVRPRILSTNGRNGRGYRIVCLTSGVAQKTLHVHRLVMLAFVGKLPPGMQTRHLDGDLDNNHLSNLAYGTAGENTADQIRHGTHWALNHRARKMQSESAAATGEGYDGRSTR